VYASEAASGASGGAWRGQGGRGPPGGARAQLPPRAAAYGWQGDEEQGERYEEEEGEEERGGGDWRSDGSGSCEPYGRGEFGEYGHATDGGGSDGGGDGGSWEVCSGEEEAGDDECGSGLTSASARWPVPPPDAAGGPPSASDRSGSVRWPGTPLPSVSRGPVSTRAASQGGAPLAPADVVLRLPSGGGGGGGGPWQPLRWRQA
jgi:hypothetical protein